jgi:transposase
MANKYSKQFKDDCVTYVQEHADLSVAACARNLGVNENTLHTWLMHARTRGDVHRGSGNHTSDEAKELARVKRQLRDTEDALKILKKAIGILSD